MEAKPFHVEWLLQDFERRQRKNARFSLRAYANQVGILPPTLSQILKNKRNLPISTAKSLVKKMGLSPVEERMFLDSIEVNKKYKAKKQNLPLETETLLNNEAHFRIIAEWEHYAILSVMDLKIFQSDATWIANYFGITTARVERCLENLFAAKLIRQTTSGKLKKTIERMNTTEDISSRALKQSHHETMDLGKKHLEMTDLFSRDFSSLTFVLNPRILPELKKRIRHFRKEIASLAETSDATEVYELAVQLFPLNRLTKKGTHS